MLQLCALAMAYGRRKYVELQFEKIFFMLKPKNVPKSFNSTLTYIHFPSILTCTRQTVLNIYSRIFESLAGCIKKLSAFDFY